MPETDPVFLVNPYCDPVVVRIIGRASYLNSGPLRDFFARLIRHGRRHFVVDFRNCTSIDSTFLGIVAGAALEVQDLEPPGYIRLCSLGPRNLELVRNLGLHRIAEVVNGSPVDEAQERLDRDDATESQRARMILDAHLRLIECDESNSARFQDVISYLRHQGSGEAARDG